MGIEFTTYLIDMHFLLHNEILKPFNKSVELILLRTFNHLTHAQTD